MKAGLLECKNRRIEVAREARQMPLPGRAPARERALDPWVKAESLTIKLW